VHELAGPVVSREMPVAAWKITAPVPERRAVYGSAPPASTVLRIRAARGRACGAPLTPETSADPAGLTARARPEARPERRAANLHCAMSPQGAAILWAAQGSAVSIRLFAASDIIALTLDLGVYRGTRWPWSPGTKGGTSMPTYVSLVKWTDQGIKNYKDTTSRAADFTKLTESLGGSVREILWTVGEYDMVTVTEVPDDEAGTAATLRVASLGNIRTTTMRAFNADEMGRIITRAG
jgi:uncharacterized protein with GYD domain